MSRLTLRIGRVVEVVGLQSARPLPVNGRIFRHEVLVSEQSRGLDLREGGYGFSICTLSCLQRCYERSWTVEQSGAWGHLKAIMDAEGRATHVSALEVVEDRGNQAARVVVLVASVP
jgi:hypothetical protein